jgi:hypothetical protein
MDYRVKSKIYVGPQLEKFSREIYADHKSKMSCEKEKV